MAATKKRKCFGIGKQKKRVWVTSDGVWVNPDNLIYRLPNCLKIREKMQVVEIFSLIKTIYSIHNLFKNYISYSSIEKSPC